MRTSRVRKIVLSCWLAGVAALCLWTPHNSPGVPRRMMGGYARYYQMPRYGWSWAPVHWKGWDSGSSDDPRLEWRRVDYGRVILSLVAWSAIVGIAFVLLPAELSVRDITAEAERRASSIGRTVRRPAVLRTTLLAVLIVLLAGVLFGPDWVRGLILLLVLIMFLRTLFRLIRRPGHSSLHGYTRGEVKVSTEKFKKHMGL